MGAEFFSQLIRFPQSCKFLTSQVKVLSKMLRDGNCMSVVVSLPLQWLQLTGSTKATVQELLTGR